MDVVTVYVTFPHREEAEQLAGRLLDERLVACANLVDGITSIYRWQGKVHHDRECVLLLKTRKSLIEAVTDRVQELHSYDCPAVVAWEMVGGSAAYARWVADETVSPAPPVA